MKDYYVRLVISQLFFISTVLLTIAGRGLIASNEIKVLAQLLINMQEEFEKHKDEK